MHLLGTKEQQRLATVGREFSAFPPDCDARARYILDIRVIYVRGRLQLIQTDRGMTYSVSIMEVSYKTQYDTVRLEIIGNEMIKKCR